MTALYLCYQGLLDPLTQTQVVAYLEGLAKGGYRLILLTFEPRPLTVEESQDWSQRLAIKGIIWHWRRYHKRPTVPATALDVLVGIAAGWGLVRRYNVRLLHARGHVPGLMAWVLQRLTRAKLLLDIRGFMAEEYADAGLWKADSVLFRVTKWVERVLVRAADGYVVLTQRARAMLQQWYPREIRNKPLQVIPCCVDFRRMPERIGVAGQSGQGVQHPTFAYVGKLGGWYLDEEMAAFVATAMQLIPQLRWQVWTQSDPKILRRAAVAVGLRNVLEIEYLHPEALALELGRVQAGLAFIKPCLSKLASSATKVGEYLAAGLPVVATSGIGDTDEILTEPGKGSKPVGVLVRHFTPQAYRAAALELLQLLQDPDTPARCRAVAKTHYHLEHVGWVRYRQLYCHLLGGAP